MKLFVVWMLSCCALSVHARSIPASADNIRELADVVLLGDVSGISVASHQQVVEITANVREIVFDRDGLLQQDQPMSFRFVQFPHAEGDIQSGQSYVISLGRCSDGNYVLIGSQFVAKAGAEGFDTRLWLDFEPQSSINEIRKRLAPAGERDGSLTDARCGQAWESSSIP